MRCITSSFSLTLSQCRALFILASRSNLRNQDISTKFSKLLNGLQDLRKVFYVDIKSKGPRDVMRTVVGDVRRLFLREEKITVRIYLI